MRVLAVVAGLCVVLAMAGCNKTQTASQTKLTEAQLWDPCTLSDGAVQATGVDPSTKDTNVFGAPQPGWKGCAWNNDSYFLDVYSTVRTMDEFRANTELKNMHSVNLSGRNAVSETQGSDNDNCGIDFPTSKGVVQVVIRQQHGSPSAGDLCAVALKSANSLNSSIPE